jgi:hypothetical protein
MIEYLDEINRLLWACEALGGGKTDLETVVGLCSSSVLRARFPNHRETIEFCSKVGIVALRGTSIVVTKLGQEFWEANPQRRYELTPEQAKLFVKTCLYTEEYRDGLEGLFGQLTADYAKEELSVSQIDDPPLKVDPRLFGNLRQLGVLSQVGTKLVVPTAHSAALASFSAKQLSLPLLKKMLEEQDQVGDLAERIALAFERERLKNAGFERESDHVWRVSNLNAAAGYDIESFNGRTENLIHNRFIEVKGSRGIHIDFHWSKNEIHKAEELGDNYWLYFVRGINLQQQSADDQPECIQNPFKKISNREWHAEAEMYHVTKA